MFVNRTNLLEKIRLALVGIQKDSTALQHSDMFVFCGKELFTYNGEVSVIVSLDDIFDEGLNCAISAKEFYDVLSKFDKDCNFIEMKLLEEELHIEWQNIHVKMLSIDYDFEQRKEDIKIDDNDFVELQDDFLDMLAHCRMKNNRTKYSGVFVKGSAMMSSDGFELNYYELDLELPTFYISEKLVDELLKISNLRFKYIKVRDGKVYFKSSDGVVISIRCLNDTDYPLDKIKSLIDGYSDFYSTNYLVKGNYTKDLYESIQRACDFSFEESSDNSIGLSFQDDSIKVYSSRTIGSYEEIIKIENDLKINKEISVKVSAEKILNMYRRSAEFYIVTKYKDFKTFVFKTDVSIHILSTYRD